jgi:hypothetical protein
VFTAIVCGAGYNETISSDALCCSLLQEARSKIMLKYANVFFRYTWFYIFQQIKIRIVLSFKQICDLLMLTGLTINAAMWSFSDRRASSKFSTNYFINISVLLYFEF